MKMKYTNNLTRLTVLFVMLFLAFPSYAYSYLDPGTGSYILQMILAALLGATFTIKNFWMRIKSYFINFLSKKEKDKKIND